MALSKNKKLYNQVTKLMNIDIVENLEDADPTHYALIIDKERGEDVVNLPLMNVLKLYLENVVPPKGSSENPAVRTVSLEIPADTKIV